MKTIGNFIEKYVKQTYQIKKNDEITSIYDYKYNSYIKKRHSNKINKKILSLDNEINECYKAIRKKNQKISFFDLYNNCDIDLNKTENIKTLVELKLFGKTKRKLKIKNHKLEKCPKCDNKLTWNLLESMIICDKCGFLIYICEKVSSRNNYNKYKSKYAGNLRKNVKIFSRNNNMNTYKLENHLKNILLTVQGKENFKIPNKVLNCVKNEIKRHNIVNLRKNLTKPILKMIIKQQKFQKYIDHAPKIYFILTGQRYVDIPIENINKIREMFSRLKIPIIKNSRPTRKSFPSYNFVIRKIVELLDLHKYIKHFPLLKSPEKNDILEEMWKKVCMELNLPYKRSF